MKKQYQVFWTLFLGFVCLFPQANARLSKTGITELVILDAAISNKAPFYRQQRVGMHIVELQAHQAGHQQIQQLLKPYKDLSALHIVSYGNVGRLQLGSSKFTCKSLYNHQPMFQAINKAMRRGGDILLYGSSLASGDAGKELLYFLDMKTHADITASEDITGNPEQGADWVLEAKTGEIETAVLANPRSLYDFDEVLLQP